MICSVFNNKVKKIMLIIEYKIIYKMADIKPKKLQDAIPNKIKPIWLIDV